MTPVADISLIAILQFGEPLTCSSTIRYAVTVSWQGLRNAIRSAETARVHLTARWRCCDYAVLGAGAATNEAANHRIFGSQGHCKDVTVVFIGEGPATSTLVEEAK